MIVDTFIDRMVDGLDHFMTRKPELVEQLPDRIENPEPHNYTVFALWMWGCICAGIIIALVMN